MTHDSNESCAEIDTGISSLKSILNGLLLVVIYTRQVNSKWVPWRKSRGASEINQNTFEFINISLATYT